MRTKVNVRMRESNHRRQTFKCHHHHHHHHQFTSFDEFEFSTRRKRNQPVLDREKKFVPHSFVHYFTRTALKLLCSKNR